MTDLSASSCFNFVAVPKVLEGHQGICDFLALHHKIHEALPANKRHFLKRRTYKDLKWHLAHGHKMVGIYGHDGNLVAQALVTLPDLPGVRNLQSYPFGQELPQMQDCAIVQTIGVHPKSNGKGAGYAGSILEAACNEALASGRNFVVAKVACENDRSLGAFERAAFTTLTQPKTAMEDGYASVFLCRPAGQKVAFVQAAK